MNAWTDRIRWPKVSPWHAPQGVWRFPAVLCGVEAELRVYGSKSGGHTASATVEATIGGKKVHTTVDGCAGSKGAAAAGVLALRDLVGYGLGHGRPWERELESRNGDKA